MPFLLCFFLPQVIWGILIESTWHMAKENIGNVDADDLLKNASSEIDKYMIEKELKYADDFNFCVALFTCWFVRN